MRSPGTRNALRWWCIRATCVFAAVYLLGVLGVATLIPYVTALLIVVGDAIRLSRRARVSAAEQGRRAALGGHDDAARTRTAEKQH